MIRPIPELVLIHKKWFDDILDKSVSGELNAKQLRTEFETQCAHRMTNAEDAISLLRAYTDQRQYLLLRNQPKGWKPIKRSALDMFKLEFDFRLAQLKLS